MQLSKVVLGSSTAILMAFILIITIPQQVLAIDNSTMGMNNTEPIEDDNATKPDPTDYEKKYDDVLLELEEKEEILALQVYDYETLVDNNQVTFYYDDGLFYPYPIDFLAIRPGHNPSYGEDETYLGQVVDSYVNDTGVAVVAGTFHNETLDCMELNYTDLFLPVYENISGYTEADDGTNDFSQTSTRNSWTTLRRDADGYVYRDFGANYFGDFIANFTLYFSDLEAGDSSSQGTMTAFSIGDVKGDTVALMGGSYIGITPMQIGATDDRFNFRWYQWTAGGLDFGVIDNTPRDVGINYYMTVSRTGTTIGFYVYSNEGRTVLIDSYVVSGDNTAYRYIQPGNAWSSATDPADHITGYLEYLWIGETGGVGYDEGQYYTTEMVGGDQALTLMYNASLPANTSMTLELSSDNSTWVNHNNQSGYESLVDGMEAVDLRDLNTTSLYIRVNMTTSDSAYTPRMYQLRLVTVTTVEAGDTYLTGSIGIFLIVIVIILPIVYYLVRKR